ncbi:MAG: hypothetical protein BM555_06870 [Crocinitomix sp. MedPE-SWsnd]|jgi:hypothetical protein|nr:MAG: hypothetical protein BM555_06870 [Crocinitomix sp. MedPE-SWsnd]
MPGWKRVATILLIVLGPGSIIYFLAKGLKNKFVELPHLGEYDYSYDADSNIVDSSVFILPEFELTKFDGSVINRDSIKGKFIVLSTVQQTCPKMEECGMSFYHFNELFFSKMVKNQGNYGNVKVLSILTDENGLPINEGPSELLLEEMEEYDSDIWWMCYGDPTPLFSWDYYGKNFMKHEATQRDGEIGDWAFVSSLVLIDSEGSVRGVSGAKKDSDIRNFFDMLKLLKKEDFDKQWEEKKKNN